MLVASMTLTLPACTGETARETNGASGSSPRATAAPSPRPEGPSVGFERVSDEIGLVRSGGSVTYGAAFVDHDFDGWPDLLVNRHKRNPRFFLNADGEFELRDEAALAAPAPGRDIYDRHACSWGEADGDGRLDLMCLSGAQDGGGQGPNRLFIQEAGSLRDVTRAAGVGNPSARARSLNWLDHDGDGDLDVFVANEIRSGAPNILFENDGRGRFSVADVGLAHETPTRSSLAFDMDNDGDTDLWVLGHGHVASRVYENKGGTFAEADIPHVTGRPWLSASPADIDGDGWQDLLLVSERRALLLRNHEGRFRPERRFEHREARMGVWLDVDSDGDLDLFLVRGAPGDPPEEGSRDLPHLLFIQEDGRFKRDPRAIPRDPSTAGNGESAAVGDADGDGLPDIFVTNGYLDRPGASYLLRNTSRTRNGSITVLPRGSAANPYAIGARVTVIAGDMVQRRQLTDGFIFRSQSDPTSIHFGIGRADSAEVRVRWPDGKRTCARVEAGARVSMGLDGEPCIDP
jgi:hypothetical protein